MAGIYHDRYPAQFCAEQLNNAGKLNRACKRRKQSDEKLGHTTLNLFAVSGLQLDLVEVNAYVCTMKTSVGRKQHHSALLLLSFCFFLKETD